MPETHPSVLLFGDPVIHSDVGNFCKRLVDSSRQGPIQHLSPSPHNLSSCDVSLLLPPWKGVILSNVVNNKNLAFNHLGAVYTALRVSLSGVDRPPLISVVHDPCLINVTQYIVQAFRHHTQSKACTRLTSDDEIFSSYCSILLFNEVIPASDREKFLSFEPGLQSQYLLGYILSYCDAVICHSLAAKKLIHRSLDLVERGKHIYVQPLPYDCMVTLPKPDAQLTASGPGDEVLTKENVKVALYGVSVDTSVDLKLLCLFIAELSSSCHVCVVIAGRNNERAASLLYELSEANDSLSVDYLGFVPDLRLVEILSEVDYVWAYRMLASGESSGTVLRALSCGACPVVAEHGSYLELPSELVLKLPPGLQSLEETDILGAHSICSRVDRSRRQLYVQQNHAPADYVEFVQGLAAEGSFLKASTDMSFATSVSRTDIYASMASTVLGYRYAMLYELQRHELAIEMLDDDGLASRLMGHVRCSLLHMPLPPQFLAYPCYSILPIVLSPDNKNDLQSLVCSRVLLSLDVLVDQLLGLRDGCVSVLSPLPRFTLRSGFSPYCFSEDACLSVQREFELCLDRILRRLGDRDDQLAIVLPVVFSVFFSEMLAPLVNSVLRDETGHDLYSHWAGFSHSAALKIQSSSVFKDVQRGLGPYANDLLLRFYNWHCCFGVSLQGFAGRDLHS